MLASVGVEVPREVAALAVHVDVEAVEAGAADGERRGHHVPGAGQQERGLRAGQRRGRPVVVQLGAPQRLVGVDIADAADQGLVEQRALDGGALGPQRGREGLVVEARVERVAGDVRDRDGRALRVAILGLFDGQAAEGPLVDEAQFAPAVGEAQPHAQVRLVGHRRVLDEELAAHPEVADQRESGTGAGERHPQVLAAPLRGAEGGAGQPGGEVARAGRLAAHRARVQHLDVGDGPPGDPTGQTTTDDLDLGEFGHGNTPPAENDQQEKATAGLSCSVARSLACCARATRRRAAGRRTSP